MNTPIQTSEGEGGSEQSNAKAYSSRQKMNPLSRAYTYVAGTAVAVIGLLPAWKADAQTVAANSAPAPAVGSATPGLVAVNTTMPAADPGVSASEDPYKRQKNALVWLIKQWSAATSDTSDDAPDVKNRLYDGLVADLKDDGRFNEISEGTIWVITSTIAKGNKGDKLILKTVNDATQLLTGKDLVAVVASEPVEKAKWGVGAWENPNINTNYSKMKERDWGKLAEASRPQKPTWLTSQQEKLWQKQQEEIEEFLASVNMNLNNIVNWNVVEGVTKWKASIKAKKEGGWVASVNPWEVLGVSISSNRILITDLVKPDGLTVKADIKWPITYWIYWNNNSTYIAKWFVGETGSSDIVFPPWSTSMVFWFNLLDQNTHFDFSWIVLDRMNNWTEVTDNSSPRN